MNFISEIRSVANLLYGQNDHLAHRLFNSATEAENEVGYLKSQNELLKRLLKENSIRF